MLRRFALFLLLGLFLSSPWPASAHALLLRSNPEANAVLPQGPIQIELFFTETLEPSFSSVNVFDSNGVRMDTGDARVDPADTTRLFASLRSLPDGVYTVSWKALSTVDGHVTTGAFPFAVGEVDAAALAAAEQASRQIKLSLGEILARWLTYLASAMLVGGSLFLIAVWTPAYRVIKRTAGLALIDSIPWRRLSALALIGLMAANVFGLLVQAGQAAGGEWAAPWSAAANSVLFTTRFGALWSARLVAGLALAGVILRARTARQRWLALALALMILLTISLGSHAAAEAEAVVPIFADWIHLWAASIWVGGLTHFAAGLWAMRAWPPQHRTPLIALLIPRFSALALVSVGTLTLTGVYASVLRVGSWEALFNSLYGQTLVVKLSLAVPMVLMGAINLFIITPTMRRVAASPTRSDSLTTRFRRIVTSEVGLGVVLLLSVGVLTAQPPAKTPPPSVTASATADDLKLAIDIAPGRVGFNTFSLTVTADGQPVNDAKEVALRFTPTTTDLPPSEAQLIAQGNGVYALKGGFLSLPDGWQVQAVVRREGQFDAFANFDFDLRPLPTTAFPYHRLVGGLLLGGALAYAFAANHLTRNRKQFLAYGLSAGVALFAVGLATFYRPAPVIPAGRANPIAPNTESVAQGEALYQINCVPCHGPQGKGDGPVGLTLNPRPADLSQHAVPGVHTDGQLFEWISNGFPGSVMPAFRENLSEDERWHVINFMRERLADHAPTPTPGP